MAHKVIKILIHGTYEYVVLYSRCDKVKDLELLIILYYLGGL